MNPFYSLTLSELFEKIRSQEEGLRPEEAKKRLERFGKNELRMTNKNTALRIALRQFNNLMMLILIGASVFSYVFGEHLDAMAIAVVIGLNAVIGFFQEYKAEKAIEALRKMTTPFAVVRRAGVLLKIPTSDIVPGDILVIEEGMQIAADARLLEARELRIIESSLTGESNAVQKGVDLPKKQFGIGDLTHMVFMGTTVSQGHGMGVVIHTGMQTEFGKIAQMVGETEKERTPLQKEIDHMIRVLAIIIGIIIAALMILGWMQGRETGELLLTGISLAVGVIPEGLPTVITLTLAIGVQSMAQKKALIRKLSAAETLGATNVICSDKTGTLTQNEMTVEQVYVGKELLQVKGNGYDPSEGLTIKNEDLNLLLKACALCNNASLFQGEKGWTISGDPTEGALLTLAKKGGIDALEWSGKMPRGDEHVFDSGRKRMSTLNGKQMFCKGAPDSLFKVSTHVLEKGKVVLFSKEKKAEWVKMNEAFAKEAYRVLALAYKPIEKKDDFKEEDLILVGLVAMMDPPRSEVKAAIETCKAAHVRVIMVTGDHALTAKAIGEKLGLVGPKDPVLTGEELSQMSEKALAKAIETVNIFARVSPEHKVQILKALQAQGNVVAMTGDGVNDAPALKKADIGVAMGITGTDVTKEASDMILMDDNFSSIVAAIEKGRIIYRNIKKSIRFLLSTNFGEILLVTVFFILGSPSPFLPLQILWINLLTDTLPAIALGMDNGEKDLMTLRPRKMTQSLSKDLFGFSLVAAVCFTLSMVIYFQVHQEMPIDHMRTFLFTTTVIFQMFMVYSVRFSDRSLFHQCFSNPWLFVSIGVSVALQLMALHHPRLQSILETSPLTGYEWSWVLGLCVISTAAVELWKRTQKKIDTV